MALMDTEQDDAEVLHAEDEAIQAVEHPVVSDDVEDVAAMIERPTNDDPPRSTEDRQG